jgi:predicted nucleotidyltransferase component of viral defense system
MNINWINLSDADQRRILEQTSYKTGYIVQAVEKDWWVTTVLEALFSLPFASQLSFKGGTSLSKCWGLINRFSEDIDIAIDRDHLGYGGNNLSRTQINNRLRRALCSFVRTELPQRVDDMLLAMGIPREWFRTEVIVTSESTVDPESIYIHFNSLFPAVNYMPASVKIEVSGRSMTEPVVPVAIKSLVAEQFPTAPYADAAFQVTAVAAKRTFLEKAFLLHEIFHQEGISLRVERMSRHLYDLEKMMDTQVETDALADTALYRDIVEHRRHFIGLTNFDYDTLRPETLNFLPPAEQAAVWEADYRSMQTNMIQGASLLYAELIERLTELNRRFAAVNIENE